LIVQVFPYYTIKTNPFPATVVLSVVPKEFYAMLLDKETCFYPNTSQLLEFWWKLRDVFDWRVSWRAEQCGAVR
jgi:hypothetical protein